MTRTKWWLDIPQIIASFTEIPLNTYKTWEKETKKRVEENSSADLMELDDPEKIEKREKK